jgi:hypothetical protein
MENPDSLKQQVADVTFLERRFGMTPRQASELVARDGVDPDKVREASEKLPHRDPLAGKPKPDEPAVERPRDVDEQRLKPVLHENNDRAGGG